MESALGVACSKDTIYLAIAKGGMVVVDTDHDRLKFAGVLEETERLRAMRDDVAQLLLEVRPDCVRILMPEPTYADSYGRIAPRAAVETVVRLACVGSGIRVEMLDRRSARARLGVDRKGRFESHIPEFTEPSGKYWSAGRNLAAAAALAGDH
jgi:hypothetical protein